MHDLIEKMIIAKGNHRFQNTVNQGLVLADFGAIKVDWETRWRLALLCKCGKKVVAVVPPDKELDLVKWFSLRGCCLDAEEGFAGRNVACTYTLGNGRYSVRLPLVVVKGLKVVSGAS